MFPRKSRFTNNNIQLIVDNSMNERQQFNKANSQLRVMVHESQKSYRARIRKAPVELKIVRTSGGRHDSEWPRVNCKRISPFP